MCNKITKISTQNKYQWIGVCAHGAAHVFWRSTQVSIPLMQLDTFMTRALAGSLPVEKYGEDYLFWLGRVAIKLNEKDYREMIDLFSFAAGSSEMRAEPQGKVQRESNDPKLVLH